MLDTFGLILEQTLSSLQPTGGDRTRGKLVVATGEPQCDSGGACPIVAVQVAVERPFGSIDAALGWTCPGDRLGNQLQIFGRELPQLHGGENVVRLPPRSSDRRLTAALDELVDGVRVVHAQDLGGQVITPQPWGLPSPA